MEKLKHRHGLKNPSNFSWLFYSRDDFCPLISIVLNITLDHHAGSMAHPLPLYWSQSNSEDEVVVETARHILLKAKVMDLASLPVNSTPPTKHTLDVQQNPVNILQPGPNKSSVRHFLFKERLHYSHPVDMARMFDPLVAGFTGFHCTLVVLHSLYHFSGLSCFIKMNAYCSSFLSTACYIMPYGRPCGQAMLLYIKNISEHNTFNRPYSLQIQTSLFFFSVYEILLAVTSTTQVPECIYIHVQV